MGIPVMIIGKSGSGKSTSLRNFDEKELYLINVSRKPLPFKKRFESEFSTDDYAKVNRALDKTAKKTIVIDDAGYLITNQFMKGHSSCGKGNGVFSLYNDIGDQFWKLIEHVKDLPEDKIVYFMMHEEKNDFGDVKPKTIGKLLDEKVCLEGMFTIVLRCISDASKHCFRTETDGMDIVKTPMDMFSESEIDNDLKMVDTTIREYWQLAASESEKNGGKENEQTK